MNQRIKILVVVDQPNRDKIVADNLLKYCAKHNMDLIITNAFNVIVKFFYHRPEFVLVGNADTYHSIYVRILSKFSIVASLPTEQGVFMLGEHKANLVWERYLNVGHNSEFAPVYHLLDLIFTWGVAESRIIERQLPEFSGKIKNIGAIRSPVLFGNADNNKAIGFLMDSFMSLLPMMISYKDVKWRGSINTADYFLLLKIMEINFYGILPLIRDKFPDTKFIFRKRFSGYTDKELKDIESYLDKAVIDYVVDDSNSLEYIANNSSVLIVCESSSASELQSIGVPAINVSNVLDLSFVNQERLLSDVADIHPYNLAWRPESEDELYDLLNKALSNELPVSPKMGDLDFFSTNVLGVNSGDPAKNIVKYMLQEKHNLKTKGGMIFDDKLIVDAMKYHYFPVPLPVFAYKRMMNNIGIGSNIFWYIMLFLFNIRKSLSSYYRNLLKREN